MSQAGVGDRAPASLARRAAFEAKTVVAQYPWPGLAIARRRHGVVVGDGTEVVIEGFPRTGTSFAVAAFRRAQPRPVAIACHVHAAAQILEGVKRRLPVMLVVREPRDTVVSFAIRNPHLSLAQATRGYIRFYRPLIVVAASVVIARFQQVTTDLGGIVDRLNERYGTAFARFEHTQADVDAVFEEIDRDYRERLSGESFERSVARPNEQRAVWKADLERLWLAPGQAKLRAEAEMLYAALAPDA